ncbi:hypothetical protein L7F22_037677 [Adiantum nelumboides]|nr:hypothetical protein [Adiantum nelumboides]
MKWECISMDFVTGLPKTTGNYDSIFVIVDKLTKVAHLIPVKQTATAADIAQVFVKEIVRLHGIPARIISDRDAKFTSKFWQPMFQSLGTQLNISTAYHPETDGQTKRVNQGIPSPAAEFGWHDPGFIHTTVMTRLTPSTSYTYKYGRFSGSLSVIKAVSIEVANENVDLVLHIGDISYAIGFLVEWNNFLDLISPISSRIPYFTAIGNHERDFPDSGSSYETPDSGGECGVAYETYFQMPTKEKDKPWVFL